MGKKWGVRKPPTLEALSPVLKDSEIGGVPADSDPAAGAGANLT